jgi:hypothetical protein
LWYQELARPENYSKAKELFVRELGGMVNENGNIKSYLNFNVAIGLKV